MTDDQVQPHIQASAIAAGCAFTFYTTLRTGKLGRREALAMTCAWLRSLHVTVSQEERSPVVINGRN